MNLLESVRIALNNFRNHKLRTFLTLLGNIVGTMSVIAVVSLIYGADQYARQVVLDEGTDVFTIRRVNPVQFLTDFDAFLESLNNPDLTLEDQEFLSEKLEQARVVGASQSGQADLRSGSNSYRDAMVRGKTEDYSLLDDMPLVSGRHLTRQDVLGSRQVAIIGWEIASDLFPRDIDPVGQEFKLYNRHFTVVGMVKDRGTVLGNNRNQFVVIPITAYQKVFGSDESIDIKVAATDLASMTDAQDEATFWLRIRHRLRPMQRDDFAIQTADQLLDIWSGISAAMYGILVSVVSVSLVVGGIVLMNIMLVSVTERTREVGIRMALGASRQAIRTQFLVESVFLSVFGGGLGIGIGFLLAGLIALASPLNFAIATWSIYLGLTVTFVIGVIFGTYPASKAARLDPVEALRYE